MIAMVFQYMDSNRMKPLYLRKEGFKKLCRWLEGVYVDQSRIDTVMKANGAKNQEDMYTRLWNDYIIPKIRKKTVVTFDPNTYVEYLGEKYPPRNIWSDVFEAHDECIELWKKI